MKLLSRLFCFLLICFQILPAGINAQNAAKTVADKTEIRHSFFIAGPKFTGIIGENGEEIWKADKSGARDGYVLPNGHTVIASYGASEGIRLFEVDNNKKIVWTYNGYGAHEFQILTTNGKKIKGSPLK